MVLTFLTRKDKTIKLAVISLSITCVQPMRRKKLLTGLAPYVLSISVIMKYSKKPL